MQGEMIKAKDLHAGDWVKNPTSGKAEWVGVRGRVGADGHRRFLIGRGGATAKTELFLMDSEEIERLSEWPELPDRFSIG